MYHMQCPREFYYTVRHTECAVVWYCSTDELGSVIAGIIQATGFNVQNAGKVIVARDTR